MRHFAIIGALLALAGLATTVATASPGNCYAIRDNSLRQQCLAETQRNQAHCYSIRDQDQKNYCLAVTSNNRTFCYSIKDSDKKAYCLSK